MWIKNNIIFNGWLLLDGKRIFNPTDDQLRAAGYEWKAPEVPEVPTPATTEFDAACVKFREVCNAIGELIGNADFKGGFDEMADFETSEAAMTEAGIALSIKWMAADKLCTYLASKIGIGQPEWWYTCWED